MISVIASISIAEGKKEEMRKIYQDFVPLVLKNEPGCIEYEPMLEVETDLPNQEKSGDEMITVVEKWKTMEDFYNHLKAPHVLDFRKKSEGIRLGVTLKIQKPLLE